MTNLVSILAWGSGWSTGAGQTHGTLDTISTSWSLRAFLSLKQEVETTACRHVHTNSTQHKTQVVNQRVPYRSTLLSGGPWGALVSGTPGGAWGSSGAGGATLTRRTLMEQQV